MSEPDPPAASAIATVSHELRTPLGGIIGMAQLLWETDLTPRQASYVEAILAAGHGMLGLVDDLLDDASLAHDGLVLAEEPFDPVALCEGVVELMQPRAQMRGIAIAATVAGGHASEHRGDARRLRQIVLNLVGNAVKFTDRGGVLVTLESRDDGIAIAVEDTGPGIPAARRAAIFAPFAQLRESGRAHEGNGLGLAITRRLVATLGGALDLASVEGRGSTFSLSLPFPAIGPRTLEPVDLGGLRAVVVARATPPARALVERLREAGAMAERLDADAAVRSGDAPDVALVDAALAPDPEALRSLAERIPARRRIVLLSPAERRAGLWTQGCGFDAFLMTPVRTRSLYERVAPERAASDGPVSESGTALVVEDDPIAALLTGEALRRLGYAVATAGGVAEARAAIAALPGDEAVLFSDLSLPDGSGLDVIRAWRAAMADAPAVAVTAGAGLEARRAALAAGFDEVMEKPVDPARLTRWRPRPHGASRASRLSQ